ncbi:transporter substrate-binding domain-containing protein [Flexivirga sp. ID2601S]|uniref:Transporter substrate-binding domain-containing protein n=1 Tax=Flexivirga aerilata TaxID=1656889 RepID=A0A849AF12_9MICO|nr:transporter substrate-binding domain-containing protein [Flexivirga aerilata]NNG39075.1 transporter substrate-binding domain-containing protein [Flexivirga aerilata]
MHISRFRHAVAAASIAATTLLVAACGSSTSSAGAGGGGGAAKAVPAADVTSKVAVDGAARALLPKEVQRSNQLTLGTTQVTGTASLPHAGIEGGKQVGLDLDIRAAVARKLGIDWKVDTGTFQTIVPGVQNGKYQVGQANFGVTKDRLQVVDFATYLRDGQSFVGRSGLPVKKVRTLQDVCGLKIATSPGTTFQKLLQSEQAKCAAAGKKPYTVQYFADTAPIYLGLQNGKVDVYFGPTLSLKVLTSKITGTTFLGEVTHTPVGFVTAKKSPIAPALVAAVNDLIKDGTYQRIFDKWQVGSSVIDKSALNPAPTF